MKRILQITGGMNRAGAETMIMNIYRKLDYEKIQFDFVVYGEEKQDYEDEIISLGGKVFHLPLKSGIDMFKSICLIRRILEENKEYIAIHIHTLHNSVYSLLAARNNNEITRIVHSHSTKNDCERTAFKKIYETITRYLIKKLAHVWYACGEEAGIYLFGRAFREKGTIVNNAIDLEIFSKDYSKAVSQLRQDYKTDGKMIIGHVGRLEQVKNHKFMIEIAEELVNRNFAFKMFFVGKGQIEDELKKYVKEKNLNDYITFCGVRSDIPVLLQFFDVFLMPSYYEGNPVTLIEAQASGLPCLISDEITEKIDVGLNLIDRASLNDSALIWADKLEKKRAKRLEEKSVINDVLSEKGYNVKNVTNDLINLYSEKRRYE